MGLWDGGIVFFIFIQVFVVWNFILSVGNCIFNCIVDLFVDGVIVSLIGCYIDFFILIFVQLSVVNLGMNLGSLSIRFLIIFVVDYDKD